MLFKIKKGLNIPLAGAPEQSVSEGAHVGSVALLGPSTNDLKPGMLVREGDHVKLGQPLFHDKQNPGVRFTSPGSGVIAAINRGERRVLQSVVVRLEGDDEEVFDRYESSKLEALSDADVRKNLLESGLWTALRTRPYSKIPAPDAVAAAMFVTAIDTRPLAAEPAVIIERDKDAFAQGLTILSKLTAGSVYVCTAPNSGIKCPSSEPFKHAEFTGPHPAGLVGTHIHLLEPVSESKIRLAHQLSGRHRGRQVVRDRPAASRARHRVMRTENSEAKADNDTSWCQHQRHYSRRDYRRQRACRRRFRTRWTSRRRLGRLPGPV